LVKKPGPIMTQQTEFGASATVLLIDDSRVMRKAISRILKDDFTLLEAEDGEQGWEILNANNQVQLVISDIEMPRMDGYELLQRIRSASGDLREIPVIVITGADDEATRRTALERGATDFVTKPVDATQLLPRAQAQVRSRLTARTLVETRKTLKEESTLDPLTRLCSRRFFLQRGTQDVAYARRRSQDLALFRLNIDKFKQIYREFGDEGSDKILVWLADLLQKEARTEDTVARVGGAEFALLAPSTGPDAAQTLATRLLKAVKSAKYTGGDPTDPLRMTASIGISNLSEDNSLEIERLLELAETRAKQARLGGGDTIVATGAELTALREPISAPEANARTGSGPGTPATEDLVLDDAPADTSAEPAFETQSDEPAPGQTSDANLTLSDDLVLEVEGTAEAAAEPDLDFTLDESLSMDSEDTLSLNEPVPDEEPVPTEAAAVSRGNGLDLERAVALLANGETGAVEPHLAHLMLRVLPLLELGDEKFDFGIAFATALIRSKLQEQTRDQ
jgi:two-component system cell cycle response regulator